MSDSEENKAVFEERQYLGYNKYSNIRRILLAMVCFLVYYFSDRIPALPDNQNTDDFLFVVGIAVLVISVLLLFILHIHTKVIGGSLILDGLWTARKVKIDLASITKVEVGPYSKYMFNRPVYNLHHKGKIRFYTRGNEAVNLTDKDGLQYVIGSQRAEEMAGIISTLINNTGSRFGS